ncbi:cation:proton antiporter domain-containing protein [Streptomyces mirabilis]|uniref:Sodium/hydrogen exchanger family protein n=1 Tax=Streptomyces mirabilis TaxID=68239 RepID=A0A1I2UG15_9ACTN|nr:cation:proton antiporter [Streptomyces mirabilis]SFG74597.1 Sodium/hydrogen exchanger family protein [Streptomyces mirabilis]
MLGTVARHFALSPAPLYWVAGPALGDGGLAPVPAARDFVDTGASIGVILLLLPLGLDFTVREFTASLRRSSAAVDLALNAATGAVAGWLLGLDGCGILALAGATYVSTGLRAGSSAVAGDTFGGSRQVEDPCSTCPAKAGRSRSCSQIPAVPLVIC